jgi:hypothetical protein
MKAKYCVEYQDMVGREEAPGQFDPDARIMRIAPVPADYEPPSFHDTTAYVELKDGTGIPCCMFTLDYDDSLSPRYPEMTFDSH